MNKKSVVGSFSRRDGAFRGNYRLYVEHQLEHEFVEHECSQWLSDVRERDRRREHAVPC